MDNLKNDMDDILADVACFSIDFPELQTEDQIW